MLLYHYIRHWVGQKKESIMKLNLDILCDYLPKSYSIRRFGPSNRNLSYGRPLLYASGIKMESQYLYITHTASLPTTVPKDVAVICLGSKVPQNWRSSGAQVLQLEGNLDLASVIQDIFKIYDKFDYWDAQIRDAIEDFDDFDIKKIVRLGAELMENHIGFSDSSMRMLINCSYTKDKNGFANTSVKTSSDIAVSLDSSIWENIKTYCSSEREVITPYMTNADNDAYCCNLYSQGCFMGCMFINSQNRLFRESDYALADYLFNYLKKAFLRFLFSSYNETSPEAKVLISLLEQQSLSQRDCELLTLAKGAYWNCFQLQKERGVKNLPKEYMCEALSSSLQQNVFCTIYHDEIIGLLKFSNEDVSHAEHILDTFESLIHRMGYLCGLSNRFEELQKAFPYFAQSRFCVEYAMIQNSNKILNYFNDCTLEYILYECSGEMPREALYPDGLLALIKKDHDRGSEYIKTLDTYLTCERNALRTAEKLYIHRSSLLKRLEKIKRILNMDLDDPNVRLCLCICLKLINTLPY